MWTIILIALASSLAINFILFLIAFRLQSDKLTDTSYAVSFLTIDVVSFLYTGRYTVFNWTILFLAAIWALRIGSFLLLRVLKVGKDHRFDNIRNNFWRFGKFWLGQALAAWVLMLPASIALYRGGTVTFSVLLGILIWLVGLLVEAVADYQKFAFKLATKNAGKWIQEGIWKYARHPNYFGEILVWCGIYTACFMALHSVERLVGLASPLSITFVLLFVSGVPVLEKSADKRWGHLKEYQVYKRRTRLLIPLPK